MDALFTKVHGAAHRALNWVGMTVVGGLHPRMAGELSMKMSAFPFSEAIHTLIVSHRICFGETTEGNDFEDSCINFDKHIVESFEGFLHQVFCKLEYSLPSQWR
jgi:hypothetical protein